MNSGIEPLPRRTEWDKQDRVKGSYENVMWELGLKDERVRLKRDERYEAEESAAIVRLSFEIRREEIVN